MKKRRRFGRYFFVLILAIWWVLGLYGLESARRPSVPLVAAAALAGLGYKIVASARKRRALEAGPHRPAPSSAVVARSCVVIRLGESGPSPS